MNPPTRIPFVAAPLRWKLGIERSMFLLGSSMLLASFSAIAAPRTSANYSVAADITDAAGKRTASASYTNDGSLGGIAGISTVAVPAETAKHGYIAQLYEVTALQITATPNNVNEGATAQLSGAQLLDDNTTIALAANAITWSIQSGPLASISANGLTTTAAVYQNTAASAQGTFAGVTGAVGLTVLETIPDNFGTYAGDGIGDDWQVQYFGLNNPNAAPLLDPDHDGNTNLFEFTAGLVPTDPLSVFKLRIEPAPGFPSQRKIIFSPRLTGRTYTVKSTTTLGPGAVWIDLTGNTTSDAGNERTVTDTAVTGDAKFYKVEIVKP